MHESRSVCVDLLVYMYVVQFVSACLCTCESISLCRPACVHVSRSVCGQFVCAHVSRSFSVGLLVYMSVVQFVPSLFVHMSVVQSVSVCLCT